MDRLRALAGKLNDSTGAVQSRRADSRFQIEVTVCSQSSRLTRGLAEEHSAAAIRQLIGLRMESTP